jgi:hypothetical protein
MSKESSTKLVLKLINVNFGFELINHHGWILFCSYDVKVMDVQFYQNFIQHIGWRLIDLYISIAKRFM